MQTPQTLAAPRLQYTAFIFEKFYINLHSHAFVQQSITLQYIHLYFFLIEILLAYPVISVIQYFHKRHSMFEFDVILIVCYSIVCS